MNKEIIKEWIEDSLDNDAHGKWVRAPKFDIIQDVAELMSPPGEEKAVWGNEIFEFNLLARIIL